MLAIWRVTARTSWHSEILLVNLINGKITRFILLFQNIQLLEMLALILETAAGKFGHYSLHPARGCRGRLKGDAEHLVESIQLGVLFRAKEAGKRRARRSKQCFTATDCVHVIY